MSKDRSFVTRSYSHVGAIEVEGASFFRREFDFEGRGDVLFVGHEVEVPNLHNVHCFCFVVCRIIEVESAFCEVAQIDKGQVELDLEFQLVEVFLQSKMPLLHPLFLS